MSTREYHAKRNFNVTSEPKFSSRHSKSRQKEPIFVVQEHHASHLHWDFRLEMDGVLKSWAVPKGPSTDPKIKRLAVEVEDHPLEYANFEGTIPEKQYGAGEVFIWDKGTWENLDEKKNYKKTGKLDFELKGKRLHGRWKLIRTKQRSGKKNQWLLMKGKDDPKLEFVPPQLALLSKVPPVGDGWIHEIKFDGYRTQAHIHHGDVKLLTRTSLDWTAKYSSIHKQLEKVHNNVILDGEIVSLDEQGRSRFHDLQDKLKSGSQDLYYYVFDILHLDGEDLTQKPLKERQDILRHFLSEHRFTRILLSEPFDAPGAEFLKISCENELEGIVSKRLDAPYTPGRTGIWIKSKCHNREEFVIGGYTEPQGSRSGFGALLLGVYEDQKLRYVGRVGTGFDQKLLKDISGKLKKLKSDETPFDIQSPRERSIHWVKPVLVAEVTYANWTKDKILRVPVFEGLREDKPAKQVKKEESISDLKVTHPERIVYKKEKISKAGVVDYYSQVAQLMLPWAQNRPLSLLRCPQGTSKECFYQKHVNDKDPVVHSALELLQLVQYGTIEFHARNTQAGDDDSADQIVIDFDPGGGVNYRDVIDGALRLRVILKKLGLESFANLTGGKGVHVRIPIEAKYTWAQTKNFAHSLVKVLIHENPIYIDEMSLKKRKGKIFVDFYRNNEMATAIVPYSLRARTTSSVAMPITWAELKKSKAPDVFTLKKALQYLKKRKKDPWAEMLGMKQRIAAFEEDE